MTQQEALDILKTGEHVYLTGCAGSGKTHVLSRYITYLRQQGMKVGITASTGVAATQLGGMTINAWAGVGVKHVVSRGEMVELLKRQYLHKRIRDTEVLIIDEISMLPLYTFEAVDAVCRAFRHDSRPFGGIQVVLCGDFFQLPPVVQNVPEVPKVSEVSKAFSDSPFGTSGTYDTSATSFIYKSPLWDALDLQICYLDKPYRQVDLKFLTMLGEIRTNTVTKYTWDTLKERFIQPLAEGVTPTKLYTHIADADAINQRELAALPGPEYVYSMESNGNDALANHLKKSCLAPEDLTLKKDALVMFVKNNSNAGYVNGTMGRVVGFSDRDEYPIVETFSGQRITVKPEVWEIEEDTFTKAKISQVPLRLAWGITIHKSQGMTLDAAEIDLGRSFVTGMGYVALSRVRNLDGLRLRSVNRTALTVNDEVIALDKELQEKSERLAAQVRRSYWHEKNAKLH